MTTEQQQIQDTFLRSRDGAIVRCASIMKRLNRKDLAKQILKTAHINREKFEVLKTQNT
jgi:hypothetical protein